MHSITHLSSGQYSCMQTAATDAKVAHLEPLANALQEDNERLLKARRGPCSLWRAMARLRRMASPCAAVRSGLGRASCVHLDASSQCGTTQGRRKLEDEIAHVRQQHAHAQQLLRDKFCESVRSRNKTDSAQVLRGGALPHCKSMRCAA